MTTNGPSGEVAWALGIPWWTWGAIAEVTEWIATQHRALRVFEWGAGGSTVYFARMGARQIVSVDDNRQWSQAAWTRVMEEWPQIRTVHNRNVNDEPDVQQAPPSSDARFTCASLKAPSRYIDLVAGVFPVDAKTPATLGRYAAAINAFDDPFDIVLVDGRCRAQCLANAGAQVAPGGLLILDNSEREAYSSVVLAYNLAWSTRHRGNDEWRTTIWRREGNPPPRMPDGIPVSTD